MVRAGNILYITGLALCMLLLSANGFAQKVKIKVDAPKEAWIGEEFALKYILEDVTELDEINIDEAKGLEFVAGPRTSYNSSVVSKGGDKRAVYSLIVTYIMRGDKAGKYSLPKAEFTVDGKKYKSGAASVQIKDITLGGKETEAFVRTIISRTSVSPEDTLTLTYRLYTNMNVRQIVKADYPRMQDFYGSVLTRSRQQIQKEEYNGKTYNVVDIRKMILQPKDVGLKTIPEGSVTVEFGIPTGKKVKDAWGETYIETIKKIEILPLEKVKLRVQQLVEI